MGDTLNTAFFASAMALATIPIGASAQEQVDLELILAVDASSSVNAAEFQLQMNGISGAFRHPAVQAAIRASGDLGIAVSLVQWADNRKQFVAVDWRHLRTEAEALSFADTIDATPRILVGGGTAIGGAIAFSLRQLARNDYDGRRKVIDISGDGRTNQGARTESQRDLAVEEGVTINGLAILNEDPYIDGYYLYNVIGGTGAFVMSATNYEDFSAAMLEKLVKEIAGTPIAQGPDGTLPDLQQETERSDPRQDLHQNPRQDQAAKLATSDSAFIPN
ncbi:MAG: DUF1194 domain-containing protein [Pseudomonadota bacterium]